ncbi:hypothetical protein, partial [Caldalkalibacillus thermarum]
MELSVSLFCINASVLAGEMDHHPMIRLVRKNYRKDTFICLTYPKQDIRLEWFHQASDIRQACCQISQYRVKVFPVQLKIKPVAHLLDHSRLIDSLLVSFI